MKKAMCAFIIILLFSVLLAGCGESDVEGIVLEVNDNQIKLAENLSSVKYEAIKHESVKKLQNEDVAGTRESLALIDITYDYADEFSKGDEVEVWINGDVMTSYPGKAEATKISLIK